jgi:hypothetical protein
MGGRWLPIYLKLEEAGFFLDQLGAHERFPRIVWFYLSAFLSSARSITFHIQKQIAPHFTDGTKIYTTTCEEILVNDVGKFFRDLRNRSEKEMYPALRYKIIEAGRRSDTEDLVYTLRASSLADTPSLDALTSFEKMVNEPAWHYRKPFWYFEDFPGGPKELGESCRDFLGQLQRLVDTVRVRLEATSHGGRSYQDTNSELGEVAFLDRDRKK